MAESQVTSSLKQRIPSPNRSKFSIKNMLVTFVVVVVLILIVAISGFVFLKPKPAPIVGQVEVEEIRISGKVPGRITEYLVQEGQIVHKGDTLVRIYTPEVEAKKLQATAATRAAEAQLQKALVGARSETKQGAYALWQKAKAGLEIAEKSFARVEKLHSEGVVADQKYDEAYAQLQAMRATEMAARSQYEMAENGAQQEDKMAAAALVDRAGGAVSEVNSYLSEGALLSPIDATVSEIFPHVGELVGSGAPIMNLANEQKKRVVFTVREDLLTGVAVGEKIKCTVPALNNRQISLEIKRIKDRGSYAAWKAAKPNQQIDYRNFEVIAEIPESGGNGLIAGMTVVWNSKKNK